MTSAGDYTVLKQIIANYSFQGGQASITSSPIITTNTTSGSLQVAGGAVIQGNTTISGLCSITNTTPATSVTTGALQVAGGAAIAGNLFVGTTQVPIIQYGTVTTGTNTVTLTRAYTTSSSYVVSLTFRGVAAATDILYYTTQTTNSFVITSTQPVSWVAIGT